MRGMALQDWLKSSFHLTADLVRTPRHQWVVAIHPAGIDACEWYWGEGGQVTILERSRSRRIIWMGCLPQGVDNLVAALRLLVPVYRHGQPRD